MFVIFGLSPKSKTIGQGIFQCPRCRSAQGYKLQKRKQCISLFFIPLIPIKRLEDLVKCNQCKTQFYPDMVLTSQELKKHEFNA